MTQPTRKPADASNVSGSPPKARPAQSGAAATASPRVSATVGDLLGIEDCLAEMPQILRAATRLKDTFKAGRGEPFLAGKSAILLFEKASTRTRVSFEIGLSKLGMSVVFLHNRDIQLGRGETLEDTAKVLSRYADIIAYRAMEAESVRQLAEHATIPVVNALDNREHPLQALADIMAVQEHFGQLQGLSLSWVGDGNNVATSLVLAAASAGIHVRIASPKSYSLPSDVIQRAQAHARASGGSVKTFATPQEAVEGADIVATDTWISMGDESEESERVAAFMGWTVDEALLAHAAPHAMFLHCLPAHYGQEVTKSVAHGPKSLVWEEAENRMWVQMAVVVWLLAPTTFASLVTPAAKTKPVRSRRIGP
ncbi:MAG: ornithine carbamoyltransferase [Thermoplasmatota archaeon]